MVDGRGPRAAPRVDDEPAYAGAPLRRLLTIGAYLGAPLVDVEGKVFGTLCGFDPEPLPASLAAEVPIVEVIADLLSGLLRAELHATVLAREARAARGEAVVDPLTGLSNRRAWEQALASEEERCRRYGAPACVIAIGLEASEAGEPAGDEDEGAIVAARVAALLSATQALHQIVRKPDTLARVDDDAFCVLGVECNNAEALALLSRLEHGLHGAGVPAALGLAMRSRSERLDETERRAFDAMEEHARARALDRLARGARA
jgi:diguanylate cyclase (GGDEF)-like protein